MLMTRNVKGHNRRIDRSLSAISLTGMESRERWFAQKLHSLYTTRHLVYSSNHTTTKVSKPA